MSADQNFIDLGLELPHPPTPKGVYKPVLIDGKHCYVSGQGPYLPDGNLIMGKVGKDLTADEGKHAAQQVGLTILATLKEQLGSLDKIKRVIKVL
ncbi:MAG: RidA family protein, partial [Bacteroidetes bacterium]|nr:RidA family protein [Bacteroidota bacterium]